MHFTIILILCTFSMGQEVTFKNLKDNPGILPVYQGQAKIQTSRHDFIHYYPLQPIAEDISFIEKQFEVISNVFEHNSNFKTLDNKKNYENLLVFQLRRVQEKYRSVSPFPRKKRALFDGLGSVIKAISGNLDQEDANYYNEAIKRLTENDKNIMSQFNHHMSLNTKIMKKFTEKITLISQNQGTLAKEIDTINDKINKLNIGYETYQQTNNAMEQLHVMLQIILEVLDDLEDAINLAKINILHNSLIKEEELHWIITSMIEHHTEKQLLYSKKDFYKYYNIIEVDAYYTNNTIVFILHVPVIFPSPFAYYHLFSIPSQNLSTIIPFASYLLTNSEEQVFQYNELPCKKIGNEFLCKKKLLQDMSGSEDCIIQILQIENEAAFCKNIPVVFNSTIIEEISEANYIAIFPHPTKVLTKCSSTTVVTLQGTYLIQLPHGCEFKTNKESFINTQMSTIEKPLTLPKIKIINVQNVAEVKPLKLDKIHLDELDKLTKDEEHLQLVPIEEWYTANNHYWVTPIYILLTILVLFIGYKIYLYARKSNKINNRETVESEVCITPFRFTSED